MPVSAVNSSSATCSGLGVSAESSRIRVVDDHRHVTACRRRRHRMPTAKNDSAASATPRRSAGGSRLVPRSLARWPGITIVSTPVDTRTVDVFVDGDVAHPETDERREVGVVERPSHAGDRDAGARPVEGQQRQGRCPRASSSDVRARAVQHADPLLVPPARRSPGCWSGAAGRGRRSRRARGRADRRRRPGSSRAGSSSAAISSASSVSVWSLSGSWRSIVACARRPFEAGGADRVHVADEPGGREPGGERVIERAVGGDHDGAVGDAQRGRGRDRIRPGDDDHGFVHDVSLRRHYPDQVLGSVAATTLSARRTSELPVWISRGRGYSVATPVWRRNVRLSHTSVRWAISPSRITNSITPGMSSA